MKPGNSLAFLALNYSPGVIVGRNNIITLNGKDHAFRIPLSFNYNKIRDNIYYLSEYDPETGIRHGRNANIEEGRILSVNLSVPLVLFKWWESFTNVLYRYKRFEDPEYSLFSKNRMVMLRSSHSFSLPADLDFEVTGTVMNSPLAGPMIKQQGGFMWMQVSPGIFIRRS